CPACREAVAEIAVLPGLLGRLDSSMALQLLGGEPLVEDDGMGRAPVSPARGPDGEARVVSLVEAAARWRKRERRGQRMRYAGSALAAACLALVVALGVGVLRDPQSPAGPSGPAGPRLEAMQPESGPGERIIALVGLEERQWGTEITMDCSYKLPTAETPDPSRKWLVRLVAIGPDDVEDPVGSWLARPGDQVRFNGATRFTQDELVRLELQGTNGRILASYDVA
ncbi:MAG TPA: hypothetical protein VFT95_24100, partial [Micromonosporaceae bacterium]|nr:hypothetical protein [Micromonosporaceae bacterium]